MIRRGAEEREEVEAPEAGRPGANPAAYEVSDGDPEDAQRERELALLEEAAQLLASARSLLDVYPVIVRGAALIVAATHRRWRASYLALDGDRLRRVAMHDEAAIDVVAQEYPLAEYPALRRVVETRQPMYGDALMLSVGIPSDIAESVEHAGITYAVLVPVQNTGEVFGVLGLSSRDVSREQEVPVQRLNAIAHLAALAIANARHFAEQHDIAAQARSLEQAKTRFLNLAAHELRSPVTVLRGYLSMLADGSVGQLSPQVRGVVSILRAKTDEMNRLIEEMLETARMQDDELRLNVETVDLRDLVEDAVGVTAPLIGTDRVTLISCEEPLPVRGDRARLGTVVINLLDNASKYSHPTAPIEVRCSPAGALATVAVTDHGIGLSGDDQAVLFTRFGRITTPLTSHIPGTGLGLWLCREIARMHGGDIDVTSLKGEGSTFTLAIPLSSP